MFRRFERPSQFLGSVPWTLRLTALYYELNRLMILGMAIVEGFNPITYTPL